jgi:DNA-3-methyladenine glycosylase
VDLTGAGPMYVERARRRPVSADRIVAAPRIGVDYAGAWARRRLRFYLRDNPHVSRP